MEVLAIVASLAGAVLVCAAAVCLAIAVVAALGWILNFLMLASIWTWNRLQGKIEPFVD